MKKNTQRGKPAKSKRKPGKKKTDSQKYNKPKGVLLEKIVAAFYKDPGVKVERNVKLFPASGDESRKREIDVLITTQIAGMTVRFAYQCKNEKEPIGIDKIDSFVGALDDIGIPRIHGTFVCVNGFTSDALKRAKEAGIRTHLVDGLTKDRLRSETIAAVQHSVFLIPKVMKCSLTNGVGEAEHPAQFFIFADAENKPVGAISDLILGKWLNGEIPAELGEYTFEMEVPEGWYQFFKGEKEIPQKISAEVQVLGVVMTIAGEAETHRLIEAETKKIERFNMNVQFNRFKEGDVIPLEIFSDEQQLNDFIEKSGDFRLLTRAELPRIIFNNIYYPYTGKVLDKMYEQAKRFGNDFSPETQALVQAELYEIDKNGLFARGEYGFGGMPLPVITTNDDGDLVDLTLIFNRKEYDKVIALRHRYEKNPFHAFGDLLAWSYLEKSRTLFDKAREKEDGPQKNRLIEDSLERVKSALEIDPRMLAAVDHLSAIMFYKKDYAEALRAIDYIIGREPENALNWVDRAFALNELEVFDKALEAINKAEKLAKKQNLDDRKLRLIYVRRAEIFYNQKNFSKAWKDILKAWKLDPSGVVEDGSIHLMISEIINETRKIEGYWLKIEIFFFRAAAYRKINEIQESQSSSNDALTLLESIKRLKDIKGETFSKGVIKGDLIERLLERSAKRLFETSEKEWVNEQITRIQNWAKNNFGQDASYLEEFRI